jgi:hypothetical protein
VRACMFACMYVHTCTCTCHVYVGVHVHVHTFESMCLARPNGIVYMCDIRMLRNARARTYVTHATGQGMQAPTCGQ